MSDHILYNRDKGTWLADPDKGLWTMDIKHAHPFKKKDQAVEWMRERKRVNMGFSWLPIQIMERIK